MEATQALLPALAPNAHIVNISSMGGFQGSLKFAGLAAYSTSKAALCAFTELFAEEYKATGIHMNCLCLGAVQTEMLAAAFPGYIAPTSASQMAHFIADFALNSGAFFNGKIIPVSSSNP
jgi:NAD(P)-dependent dehydrogenase (short-subunit alcohol dehydrogenase family)